MGSERSTQERREGVTLAGVVIAFVLGFAIGAAACAFWAAAALSGRIDQQGKIGAEIIRELRGYHADNPRLKPETYGEE